MNKKLVKSTARMMIKSLEEKAKEKDVSLKGITLNNFNEFLDDLFQDGGEIRCEHFTDLAMDYALRYGEIESPEFNIAQWDCIKQAIDILTLRWNYL